MLLLRKKDYFIKEFDAEGYSVHVEETNLYEDLKAILDKNDYTDIIVLFHGWNTVYESDGTLEFGNKLVLEMNQQKPESVNPFYICVKWPSTIESGFEWIQNIGNNIFSGESDGKKEYEKQAKILLERRGIVVSEGSQLNDMDATEKHNMRESSFIHGTAAFKAAFGSDGKVESVLESMKDFSFGQFMRRAHTVGSRGVHLMIAELMERTSKNVKFHFYGFSMGACVAMSAAIGRAPGSILSRKLHSMFVFQGAAPSKSLAIGNQFRPLISFLKPVAGTTIFTNSRKDTALIGYKIVRSDNGILKTENAVGFTGVEDTAPVTTISCDIKQFLSNCCYISPKIIYNLNCDSIPSFNHFCYSQKDIVASFWTVATLKLHESAYEIICPVDLPRGYWTNFDVRTK